jgi:quinol monooxygenase YgiN
LLGSIESHPKVRGRKPVIVVAGHLRVAAADRDAFVALSRNAVELARNAPGCHDFAVSADSADPERINVYERWSDRGALRAFRGDGPDDDLHALILSAAVDEFEVQPVQSSA